MDRYPRFDPGAAKALQSSGLVDNRGNLVGPVLPLAVVWRRHGHPRCVLRHHADVMARAVPSEGDALTVAVVEGHAGIVQRLLDHGADVCADDHRICKSGSTLASIGRHQHVPETLVLRLDCRAAR